MPPRRPALPLRLLLVCAALAVGFLAGGLLSAAVVRPGDALASATTVALFAVGSGLAAAIAAGWATTRLAPGPVVAATIALVAVAVALAAVTVQRRPPRLAAGAALDTGTATTSRALTVTGGDSLLGLMRLGATADGSGLLPTSLDLHGGPGDTAPVLTTVTRWSDLMAEEIGYEEPAIAVFRVAHPWYLVETRDSVLGWVRLPEGATVVPLVELLPDRLSYLTTAWDGRLHATPGAGDAVTVSGFTSDDGEVSAQVHEARHVGDALWLRVSVHRESPCETLGEVEVVAEGWIPAWTGGKPTAWYYSRGC